MVKPRRDPSADAVVVRHAQEDARESALLERIGPTVASLKNGINYFETPVFLDLAGFFLSGMKFDDALTHGEFWIRKRIQIVRTPVAERVTVSDMAKRAGVGQRTMWNWVSKLDIPYVVVGRKKLYDLAQLKRVLESGD